jgi:hypothetical protein
LRLRFALSASASALRCVIVVRSPSLSLSISLPLSLSSSLRDKYHVYRLLIFVYRSTWKLLRSVPPFYLHFHDTLCTCRVESPSLVVPSVLLYLSHPLSFPLTLTTHIISFFCVLVSSGFAGLSSFYVALRSFAFHSSLPVLLIGCGLGLSSQLVDGPLATSRTKHTSRLLQTDLDEAYVAASNTTGLAQREG